MRWVFFTLLILNAFYFAWAQLANVPAPVSDQVKGQGTAGTALTLLTEQHGMQESASGVCSRWGPFNQISDAQLLLQQLLSLDVAAVVNALEDPVGGDYWVYLAPQVSAEAAARLLREVTAGELEGHLIGEGDLQHGVSLGLYARRGQAEQVIERARAAGYTPYMRIVTRTQKAYWVRVSADSQRLVDEAFIKRIEERFKGVTHQLKSC